MRLNVTALAAATLTLAGCTLDYNITMTPDGGTLHRETTVSSEIEPLEISELTDAFGSPTQSKSPQGVNSSKTTLTFQGDGLGHDWGNGFGGRGNWEMIDSPIGTAHCFLECLGGDTHIADDLLALQDGIDAVDSLIRRQLREAFQGDKLLPKMLTLLRQRIVPDAKDLGMMAWALMFAQQALPPESRKGGDSNRMQEELEERVREGAIAFLWQREWITTDEAALLSADPDAMNDLANKILARALGMDMKGDWHSRFSAFQEQFDDAFPKDFDKEIIRAFTKAVGEHSRLAVAWAATTQFFTSRDVNFRLNADSKPAMTNGRWNQSLKAVEWELSTAPLAVGITAPPLCWSAIWAEPNATAQDSILGHVGVKGEDLAKFCLAWNTSGPKQRKAVQDVLNSFARARSGADEIKPEAADLLGECMRIMMP